MSSDTRYTLVLSMHAKLSKGGYLYVYEIRYEGVTIGTFSSLRETRRSAESRVYMLGEREFANGADLKAAHQASLQ